MSALQLFRPTRSRPWDRRLARHLLERAGFGGDREAADELVKLGPSEAVASLMDYRFADDEEPLPEFLTLKVTVADIRALPENERQQKIRELTRQMKQAVLALKVWWLRRMVTTPRPLEEKLTLFWHGHFATEAEKVKNAEPLYRQNWLLRRHAKGNLRDLLLGISRDPAMLFYLDNHLNQKGRPNENYARELMELFSLGIGHYTESDVQETARAFTGWSVTRGGRRPGGETKFQFLAAWHDEGRKTILGRTGNLGGEDVVDLLLEQPATAEFIVRKLWRFFVGDQIAGDDEQAVRALAQVFRASGYQVGPILETIFRSELFYAEPRLGSRIKSPAELVVGTVRRLRLTPDEGHARLLTLAMSSLGQSLFDPPNVAGWPGGREWINTSTLLERYNVCGLILNGGAPAGLGRRFDRRLVPAAKVPVPDGDAAAVVRELADDLLAVPLDEEKVAAVTNYLTSCREDGVDLERACRGVMHLLMSTPHYQVC